MAKFKDVDMILNPERSVGEGIKAKDLSSYDFPQIVNFFEDRLLKFYFLPLESLIKRKRGRKRKSNLGFILIAQCSMIIDTLSSYHYPSEASVIGRFKAFLENDFQYGFQVKFKKNGTSRYWEKPWNKSFKYVIRNKTPSRYDVIGKSIGEIFYFAFRNSLIHNASILSCGGYIYNQKNLIKYSCWKSINDGFEISINPVILLEDLRNYLYSYTENLKKLGDPDYDHLREDFKIKFRFDFGYAE